MSDNPYSPPSVDLEKPIHTDAGSGFGSLESGIRGDYEFGIGELMKEAWEVQKGNKLAIWLGLGVATGCMMVLLFILGAILGTGMTGSTPDESITSTLAIQFGSILVIMPMMAGLFMMVIKLTANVETGPMEVFAYFNQAPKLILWYFMQIIFTYLGIFLLIIPGIYLAFAYQLSLPVMIDKKINPWLALEASRKAITHNWFRFFFLAMSMGFICGLSMFTIIGPIWTIPWYFCTIGILYRRIFGLEGAVVAEPIVTT